MICINCGNKSTAVFNSRQHRKSSSIWRRRRCDSCDATFTTYEIVPLEELLRIEIDNNDAPYRRGELVASIITALSAAQAAPDDAIWLLETIEQKIIAEISSGATGTTLSGSGLSRITYETLTAYHSASGLSYGLAHGIIQPKTGGTTRRRRGRPIGS